MKNKPVDMMEIQQNSISEAVNMAANNFMILNVTVGRWMGTKKLTEARRGIQTRVKKRQCQGHANVALSKRPEG